MKRLLSIFILTTIIGCTENSSELAEIQSEYLKEQISADLLKTRKTVEETGMPTMGVKFLRHSELLVDKLDSLETLILNEDLENIDSRVMRYINFAEQSPDSVELDASQIQKSIQYINNQNTLEFTNNLKLFTLQALSKYRTKYNSYFYMYDWIRPVILPERYDYKVGEEYKGDILLEASNSGILPIIKVDLPDDDKGYFELPVSNDSRAKLKIDKLKRGTNQIKVKVTQWNNGQERTLDQTLEIHAE